MRSTLPAPEVLPPPPLDSTGSSIPSNLLELYETAGASDAMLRLERLTRVSISELPTPGKPSLR